MEKFFTNKEMDIALETGNSNLCNILIDTLSARWYMKNIIVGRNI